jgi:hypothetical protein
MFNETITLRSWGRVAWYAFLLGQVAACQPERQEELRGSLYFGAGKYLARIDLSHGSVDVETNLGDVEIQQISPLKDRRLLLTVLGRVNQQDRHSLVLYDLGTRQTLTIAYGRNGHYLPGSEVLVYDNGVSLILAVRDGRDWQKTDVLRHAYNAALQVVPVSATRFLYALAGQAIHVYDTVSRRAIELTELSEHCRLDAALWDSVRERLLCRKQHENGGFDYVMVSLDGAVTEPLSLPESRNLQPIAFLPDQDVLILTERGKRKLSDRQQHAIWVYRFDSGSFYRLEENQHLGRSVVYEPH